MASKTDRKQLYSFCVSWFVFHQSQGSCSSTCDESAVHSLRVLAAHLGKVHSLLTQPQTKHFNFPFLFTLHVKFISDAVNEYFTTLLLPF